jgi:hypothetical protein
MATPPQLRSNEMQSFSYRGPFGGYQSELPPDDIEDLGFLDTENMMFRKGVATPRPPANALPTIPPPTGGGTEPLLGVADFFNAQGTRQQVVITPTRLLQWDPNTTSWNVLTGTLTGGGAQIYTWTVVNNTLCFDQGTDVVQIWDGIGSTFGPAAVTAVAGKYVFELGKHLLVMNTIEQPGSVKAEQRVHWTGAGDPTDWTSFDSGQDDLLNDLGPITGGIKLFQYGYIFQQLGITLVQLTGNGLAPFYFSPLSNHAKGCIAPYSISAFGDNAAYVGKDDIYIFDGTQSYPIGSAPVDGRRRSGARRAIFSELINADLSQVFGYLSSSINGNDFDAYWLFIPGGSTWVYHFAENNWTRFVWPDTPSIAGTFNAGGGIRIEDLVGTIAQQTWVIGDLTNANPLDQMFLGYTDMIPNVIDFTGTCESVALLKSGQSVFRDRRHAKTVKQFVFTYVDNGSITIDFLVSNEDGQTVNKTITVGNGSGQVKKFYFSVGISGQFITWQATIQPGTISSIAEIMPLYDTGGDFRGVNA